MTTASRSAAEIASCLAHHPRTIPLRHRLPDASRFVQRVASAFVQHGQATATGRVQEDNTTWESVNFSADGYLLGSYRIATAPEANSSRLRSFKSTCFDSPANNVGP